MTDNQTLDVKKEETTPSVPSTDTTQVPGTQTEDPSEKTQTTESQTTESATTDTTDSETTPPSSRAAQRIGELISKNKGLQDELKAKDDTTVSTETEDTPPVTDTAPTGSANERAAEFLKGLGFTSSSDVASQIKEQVQDLESRMILDTEKQRLEGVHDGDDGLPTYDHDKVMQHARATGIYNPEAAYNDLFKKEIVDKAIKDAKTPGTFTEKPSAPSSTDTQQLDRAALARILSSPEGKKWYDDNRDKVLAALQQGDL